jgi:hypothetical protein
VPKMWMAGNRRQKISDDRRTLLWVFETEEGADCRLQLQGLSKSLGW